MGKNLINQAFSIINKVAPLLNQQKWLDGLRPYFDPNLSKDENKAKMMEAIKGGLFGKKLAEVAGHQSTESRDLPEMLKDQAVQAELEQHGVSTSDVDTGEEISTESGDRQIQQQKF